MWSINRGPKSIDVVKTEIFVVFWFDLYDQIIGANEIRYNVMLKQNY